MKWVYSKYVNMYLFERGFCPVIETEGGQCAYWRTKALKEALDNFEIDRCFYNNHRFE